MPLDEIKRNIEANARSEAESIRSSAMSESRKILDDAAESAKKLEKEYESETAKETERMRQMKVAEAEREARIRMLEATDAAVRRESKDIRSELSERLRKSDRYGMLFKEAMKKAQEVAPASELVVQMNKNDEHFIKGSGMQVQIEYANILGLIIRSKDGSMKINATLDRLVDSSMEDVMKVIMSEIKKGHSQVGTEGAGEAHHAGAVKRRGSTAKKSARAAAKKTAKKKKKER